MDLEQFILEIIPFRQKLLNVACKMMENESDAEDVIQETLLKLWEIRNQLDGMNNLGGFAMQVTKNACIDKIRHRKIVVSAETLTATADHQDLYTATENRDSIQLVKRIIDTLPTLQRRIIMMRDVEGYELGDIAQIMQAQVSSVTMNLSRARKKVREIFIRVNTFKMETEYEGNRGNTGKVS